MSMRIFSVVLLFLAGLYSLFVIWQDDHSFIKAAFSNETTFETASPRLSTPEELRISGVSPTSVELTWNSVDSPDLETYAYRYREDSAETWSAPATLPTPAPTTATVTGLEPVTRYHFQVRAVSNTTGNDSSWTRGPEAGWSSPDQVLVFIRDQDLIIWIVAIIIFGTLLIGAIKLMFR